MQLDTHFVYTAEMEPAPACPRAATAGNRAEPHEPTHLCKANAGEELISWQRDGGNSEALETHVSIILLLR